MALLQVHEYELWPGRKCQYEIEEPSICPLCKRGIHPEEINREISRLDNVVGHLTYFYKCNACQRHFIAVYECAFSNSGVFSLKKLLYLAPNSFNPKVFDTRISDISPKFVCIYNQAFQAEEEGLDEIAGMGLRKSLEFLIKDYLKLICPDESEDIIKMDLGKCISEKVKNDNIRAVASRSAWLGNDFAHYQRRFEDKDISDLHEFIDAVVYWIGIELITKKALDMEPRNRS